MTYKYTDDDYCDIYENKICDNCGKCLEMEGIDTKAIKIEDIAKNLDENKVLEEEFLSDLKASLDEDTLDEIQEENLDLKDIYEKFGKTLSTESEETDFEDGEFEYEDAFEHIEYLDDTTLFDDHNIEDMTEELYPGVRRIKSKKI